MLTFPSRSNHDRIRTDDLRRLIAYLAGIPRLLISLHVILCGWVCVAVPQNDMNSHSECSKLYKRTRERAEMSM